ncbi:Transcriptional regulator, LysR family protein [Minicystis rosea]|nr:Transcriptional regulator, LysR family protein [Minicystis rosea]
MDQLLAIRAFARVVEAGNFTKAANSLRMPKATVSKLVQTLEAHLGVQLLSRTTRRVAVTPEGLAYYEKSARVVKDLEDVDASFAVTKARPRGHLRVDTGSSTASSIVLPALPEFLERYPEIRVDLGVGDRDVDLIGDNVDCVIRGGTITDTALVSRTIARARWVTCATPRYLEKHGLPRRPRDLADHRLVMYVSARTGRVVPLRFQEKGRPLDVDLRPTVGVNESNGHYAAGLAGAGICQVFAFLAADALARGELVEILAPYRPPPYPFHVAYPPNRHVSARLRVFLDWIVEVFAKVR